MAHLQSNLINADENLDTPLATPESVALPKTVTAQITTETRGKLFTLGVGLVAAGIITNSVPAQAAPTLDNPNDVTPATTSNLAGIATSADLRLTGDNFEGPAAFDVENFAEILLLFEVENGKFARLKTRFLENFEALSPDNRKKVLAMYVEGKKEQSDKTKLMKGMGGTASFLRGIDIAQNIIKQYQETGTITEDGDFRWLSGGSALVEYFPTTAPKIIPLLANPADASRLMDMLGKVISDSIAKDRAEIDKNRAETEKYKNEADKNRAEAAELDRRNKILEEINNMLRKALGK